MKKGFKILLVILFLMVNFMPFYKAEAASSYTVEMVSNQSGNKVIGKYSSYSAALNAMNAQKSTASSVATIYRDGVPVDSKYAIFKFKPGKTYNLYTSATGGAYTYVHGSYGTDAALLGYSDNGRVKIMISGYTGWTEINNGVVTPISLMGINGNMINVPGGLGIRIRKTPSLKGSVITQVATSTNFTYTETKQADGYTWYKISYNGSDAWIAKTDSVTVLTGSTGLGTYYNHYGPSGNLIHHFTYYNGSGYGDTFTNLGTAPSYLTKDVRYYSFDGNYFYSSVTAMLDDYRSGTYSHSVNVNSPHYSYYLYLPSHSVTGYTAEDLDNIIASKGYTASTSKMYGAGKYFKEAEETYGQNALMMFGTAMNESANGTSKIAMDKNNLFGYGAADSCAYDCAYSYNSVRDSIMDYASKTGSSYSLVTGAYYYGGHYGNKSSGRNVKYASDPYWGEKQASNSFTNDLDYGGKDFNSSTIGVTNKNYANVWVFDRPKGTADTHIYSLKNPNSNASVYDVSVNVVDKVVGTDGIEYYKVYTDLPTSENQLYGYIFANELNVTNNQPVITASDKTIKEGEDFNPLEGVSATDVENGNLTNKITYDSDVNPNQVGTYHVTYTVVDNSNFHASKTITVKVIDDNLPTITASDKEIKQFTEFNYMDGVKATAHDGTDLTDDVTYEETVNTDVADTYKVTYKVKDAKGKEASKTINVKVIPDEKPVINASDKEIYLNSKFDPLEGVTASDAEDGPIKDIEYDSEVKTDTVGDYKVTYTVKDSHGQVTTKTITVKVIVNQLPVINASDKTIYLNSKFDPLDGVTASDKEDGPISKINVDLNEVKTDQLGKYKVTYSVTDSYGQTVKKTITVTVSEKVLEEKSANFYFDYLKEVNGKLQLKGYNTINGIDNNLQEDIKYKIEFVNIDTDEVYMQNAERITDDSEIARPAFGSDDKDYQYSWFKINIDLNKLPDGNYNMNIISEGMDYYSKSVVSNKLFKEQITGYDGDKHVIISNDYSNSDAPVELLIRTNKLADKTAGYTYNQFDQYRMFEFNDNGTLHLFGTSYSYGGDYNNNANIKRYIIFENMDNYKVYKKELGSTTDGLYDVALPVSDGLSKTRAWYNTSIDISDIPVGNYVIYVATETNISDVAEFKEMLNRSLSGVTKKIDGKEYSFKVNLNSGNRIEMYVK